MKRLIFTLVLFSSALFAQNLIAPSYYSANSRGVVLSIDFTPSGSVLFSLTDPYSTGSVVNYKNGTWEEWNLTELFDSTRYDLSVTVDLDGNYAAFLQNALYRFDGEKWTALELPISAYAKYSKLTVDSENNIWLSIWRYNGRLFKISGSEIIDYTEEVLTNDYGGVGEVFVQDDIVWICSEEGLVKYQNEEFTIIDTSNSGLPSNYLYSFFVDSRNRRWIGSAGGGLFEWIDDSTYIKYDSENSGLTDNFINDISEDSKGRIWIATDDGFAYLENDEITKIEGIAEDWGIPVLKVDNEDNVWFGTFGNGLYLYNDSATVFITEIERENSMAESFSLEQNYPNPFNPATKISFNLKEAGKVKLTIYNALGEEVAELINGYMSSGKREVEFNAGRLGGGVYFYRLQYGDRAETKKALLLK